jgi:hypothetical protein
MIITILFLTIVFWMLRDQTRGRANLVIIAFTSYLCVIFGEQMYLENIFDRSFHVSDPSNYFTQIYHLSFERLLDFISGDEYRSNVLYYIINWIFLNNFVDQTATALFLKLTNALVFLTAYLLLINKKNEVDYIDLLILFHPFVYFMLIRNVRDAYILFFLALFIKAYKGKYKSWVKYGLMAISFFAMYTIRPFFNVLMALLPSLSVLAAVGRMKKLAMIGAVIALSLFLLSSNAFNIQTRLLSAFLSVVTFHEGYNEEREAALTEVVEGDASGGGFIFSYFGRVIQGFAVFLFTPHPINYGTKFLDEEIHGMWNIYTNFDNTLIVLGSIVNYLIVFPLMIKFFHKINTIDRTISYVVIFFVITYSIFQLGITDPRIKYSFLIFVLLGIKMSPFGLLEIKKDGKYFLGSTILFIGIMLGGR